MAESRRTCASCGTSNEEDARFCEGCGASLARTCATCGVEANSTARFCRGCGASLDGQIAAQDVTASGPVRKTVTVMFADLAGSTTFEESVDAETAREVIGRYHDLLRAAAERHRAGVTKYIGDGFMAVWGVPEIGPDDAVHAVDAAVELQERFIGFAAQIADTHGVELALRVSVNTGEVVVGAGDADLVGDALNVGARLEAECPRGRVVVGEETWRATRSRYAYESLGEVQVKGRTAPVAVYQWLRRQAESTDAAPFVGRTDEVRRVQAAMDNAVSARTACLVTVIGDPGVGKSRLSAEFARAQPDARVVEARCDLDATVALAPLVEVLRASDLETDVPADVPERDRLLRDLEGLTNGVPGSIEENFWALRRFVEVLATARPVVLVLDDIHWADTLLLDFIEHLVEWVKEAPVLVLALARPELRDIRPELVTVSRWVSEAVHLGGLDAGATAELAATVLGATRLPDELLGRLPSSTGGNPLFVRELIGMLAHDGVLVEESHGWRLTIDVDAIAIPPTIHALLASRLERLDAADRRVLEIASVVGSDFSPGTVRALADKGAEGIKLSLKRLRRLELAQPSGAYVGDEPVWRFHHVLIRDVAYRRLLKSDRADLHERLADWVAAGGQSVAFDGDEMIARHLEAAHTYRVELGIVDDHTGDLALRSARHYATSARRALDRDELVSAGTQAARGAAVAAAEQALHAELLLIGCEAYLSAGDVAAGAPLVDDLDRIADESLAPWATCYRCQFVVYTEPERLPEVDARLQGAIDEFSRRKDPAGLAKAHRVRASARSRLGRIGDCEADLFEALIAARQSGDHRQITAALGAAPGAALWGPSTVPKAGGRCLDVVRMQRMTTAAPSLEATSLRHLAVLELLRGRPDKARKMLADARQVVADLGLRHGLMETEYFAGLIESMEGDAVAAEPHFRTALDGFKALGVGADAGQAAAFLARMVLAQGRVDEADQYAAESERLAGRNLKTAIAWRAVRAEILSAHGRHEEARTLARDAVAVAADTDLVLDHAEACLALRRVLEAAGDAKGASAARSNAEALYTAKEVTARISRVAAPAAPAPPTTSVAKQPVSSRMTVTNRAVEVGQFLAAALHKRDVGAAATAYAERFVYDDRRRWSGDPIDDLAGATAAIERILAQYRHFDETILAVRGERLTLASTRVSDDSGNEVTDFTLIEIDDDGRIIYQGRFDGDFEAAYRELDRRYYAGEGAAFAEAAYASTESIIALNNDDYDRFFGKLSSPDLHVENRSTSAFPDRSADDLRASFGQLDSMVATSRIWLSVQHWLSPHWSISRIDRDAVGEDGERYAWTRLLVIDIREGRIASICEFEPRDEEAAFAYAGRRVRPTGTRLAIANRASATWDALGRALNAADVDGAMAAFSDRLEYDDRRRLSGNPVADISVYRAAVALLVTQYDRLEWSILAIRGDRLTLVSTHLSSDAGFKAAYLHLVEVNDDGHVEYEGRFDEDDFDSAYRELDRRYYAGDGAAFAESGATLAEWALALNRADFDTMFGELTSPDLCVENRSRSAFPNRSALEYRTTLEELTTMMVSVQTWVTAICWLSQNWCVGRGERDAVGEDGEHYSWHFLIALEFRGGRVASMCEFELDDEDAAFAFAEERAQTKASRLAVVNRASQTMDTGYRALNAHDVDSAVANYADEFVFDDRRQLSGNPIDNFPDLRATMALLVDQFGHFEWRTLAVRGERLALVSSLWFNDAGFQSPHLHVCEVDDGDRVIYHGNFDEDDFDGASRELERRYYTGEGAAFAENGLPASETTRCMDQNDFDRLFGELGSPDLVVESRSSRAFPDRSAEQIRLGFEELNTLVTSKRTWNSAVAWLSPTCSVGLLEREAIGPDGEKYQWAMILASEHADGRITAIREFDPEDEEAAFAYAEGRMRAVNSRLAVTNLSVQSADRLGNALNAHHIEELMGRFSDQLVYDDRRRLTGDPIKCRAEFRAGFERILDQYSHFERRVLAVRGERLNLHWGRWSDDSGNETAYLHVYETDDDGIQIYEGRFDEDNFEDAYQELEERYAAGEGAAFATPIAASAKWMTALNRGEFDRMLSELSLPDVHFESRSRFAIPERTATELSASLHELEAMVASVRTWNSAVHWLSPNWAVARMQREALGRNGEQFEWTRLYVTEVRHGLVASLCEFELEDEDAAFAYAEEKMRASSRRLAVANRSCASVNDLAMAMEAGNVDTMMSFVSDEYEYADHRRLSGDPLRTRADVRAAVQRIIQHYNHFEYRPMAVRCERLSLHKSRWSDDEGNVTGYLHVFEVDDDGRAVYEGRFDGDDFEGAYRELDRRYYAGEGEAFAEAGAVVTDYLMAYNHGDFDEFLGYLTHPEMRFENRSRSVFPDRSVAEFKESIEELSEMVDSSLAWYSAIVWVSPSCCVSRFERESVGQDGEQYSWTRIYVSEFSDGRATQSCQFDVDDEDGAFAYAEARMRESASRLSVTNRSCAVVCAVVEAASAHDIDDTVSHYSDRFEYGDHRRLTGYPVHGISELRAAFERIFAQYTHSEWRTLAVRGNNLSLYWSRWADDSGNETAYLHVFEIGDDGLILYEGRFDEDDFDGAYRDLDRRYYADEGAAFARWGAVATESVIALNRGDYDRMFGELSAPDLRLENRSSSVFPDRSIAEFRASVEELDSMISSARTWFSCARWVSPSWSVVRQQREAVGLDGERFAWTRIYAAEIRDGRIASLCQFDLDDEDAAFAYAQERTLESISRLAVDNRASRVWQSVGDTMNTHDADAVAARFSDSYVYDDRWALVRDPRGDIRAAIERIFEQYSHFEGRTLAVRGHTLQLSASHWSNDEGDKTDYLYVIEVGDDDLITYYGRFDKDDFEGAYRELERRYYADEGAAFAEAGAVSTEYVGAANRGDLDQIFGDLTAPNAFFENRLRSGFPDRSAMEFQASTSDLFAIIASVRVWNSAVRWLSPTWGIALQEREAIGRDGEKFAWVMVVVCEILDGRVASVCEFETFEEEQAFAYAEKRTRQSTSRLAVTNLASQAAHAVRTALQNGDTDAAFGHCAAGHVYDDRRRLSGDPIQGPTRTRAASGRIIEQFTRFEGLTLAVRGERLALVSSRRSDDAGNETNFLHVFETDDDGLVVCETRFDEDDFEGAYRELESRYYAGEGAAFAKHATTGTEWLLALNEGDFGRAFGELTHPEMRVSNRSRGVFPERSAAELRAALEELYAMVESVRSWNSAEYCLSPTCSVVRHEREAVGRDGEKFAWSRLYVFEASNGQCTRMCEFEVDDEEAALAYAEERVRESASRLALTNLASRTWDKRLQVLRVRDADGAVASYAEPFVYDDRRRLAGNPIEDLRTAHERVVAQYSHFEGRTLAVRGERLHLGWMRWFNDSGFETRYLIVHEIDEHGRFIFEGRFDEDDFEGAYRELARRHCAGAGAEFAAIGLLAVEWLVALNNADFDRLFGELTSPDMRVENRSSTVFPDRSSAQMRASLEELNAMVASNRSWNPAECWLSPTCGVVRTQRNAVGRDGEQYAWTRLYVFEARDGRCSGLCEFEVDDDAAAFAYAEERVRLRENR